MRLNTSKMHWQGDDTDKISYMQKFHDRLCNFHFIFRLSLHSLSSASANDPMISAFLALQEIHFIGLYHMSYIDVGDGMCWWHLFDVGYRSRMFSNLSASKSNKLQIKNGLHVLWFIHNCTIIIFLVGIAFEISPLSSELPLWL